MLRPRTVVRIIALLALGGMAGCFSLARTVPQQRQYVLGGSSLLETAPSSETLAGVSIGIRRIRVAEYLQLPALVVRHGASRIAYAEFHHWGERLGDGINRTVAGYLAGLAPFGAVDVAPWPPRRAYDFVIQLDVERFEGEVPEEPGATEGEVHLLVAWEILRQDGGVLLARGRTDHRSSDWRVEDHRALVTALDAGLQVLARDLVVRMEALVGEAPAEVVGIAEPVPHILPCDACSRDTVRWATGLALGHDLSSTGCSTPGVPREEEEGVP